MTTNKWGRTGGFFTVGEVIDRMDPSQSGKHKVNWKTGGAAQDQLTDTGDHPWSSTIHPSSDPSLNQTGGPHTGLRPGTKVFGISIDGQDYMIMGTMPSTGSGSPDGSPTYDSDIPQPAKDSSSGADGVGVQPRHGDVRLQLTEDGTGSAQPNDNADTKSIIQFGVDESTNGAAKEPGKETIANQNAMTA